MRQWLSARGFRPLKVTQDKSKESFVQLYFFKETSFTYNFSDVIFSFETLNNFISSGLYNPSNGTIWEEQKSQFC